MIDTLSLICKLQFVIELQMSKCKTVFGAKTGEPRGKSPATTASRTWLALHVPRAGFEPIPDTAVR